MANVFFFGLSSLRDHCLTPQSQDTKMPVLTREGDMTNLSIKSSIYFNAETHQALRLRAASGQTSMSALVNEAVKQMMHEDLEDLAAFAERAAESEISQKALLANLKRHGKL